MLALMIACAGMMSGPAPEIPPPPAETLRAYEKAKAAAGADADARVRLALWCEARCLAAERDRHLAEAVAADPAHPKARGLMGLVEFEGQWIAPDEVAARIKADPARSARLAQYGARRGPLVDSADDHHRLGLWCAEQGLNAEAEAHFLRAVRLDPRLDAAWKALGYKKRNGLWMSEEQFAATRTEKELQAQADRKWKPLLAKDRAGLAGKDRSRREEAEARLAEVTDPRAVPAIGSVFATGPPAHQSVAAKLLGQIEGPAASKALVSLAIFAGDPEVREEASGLLRKRDPREFLGALIALLAKRLKYEIRHVEGPNSPGVLYVEGEKFNLRQIYQPQVALEPIPDPYPDENIIILPTPSPASAMPARVPKGLDGFPDPSSNLGKFASGTADLPRFDDVAANTRINNLRREAEIRGVMERNAQAIRQNTALAQERLANDTLAIESRNEEIREINGRVLPLLREVSRRDFAEDPAAWRKWWAGQKGDAPKPTGEAEPRLPEAFDPASPVVTVRSSFAAGTPVRTIEGTRPIESIRVGDQVLVEDTKLGKLQFRPVVATSRHAPDATLRVDVGGESIVATEINRFWKAGKGWTMARELKPGDLIRTLGGVGRVASVKPDEVVPVFNLEVAQGRSLFVGKGGTLVHDNSLVEPTPTPFDAPTPAAAPRAGKR